MSSSSAATGCVSPCFGATDSDGFGIHNLPYGVFSVSSGKKKIGVAVGSKIVDCGKLAELGVLPSCLQSETLNDFMGQKKAVWDEVRSTLKKLVVDFEGFASSKSQSLDELLVDKAQATMHLPCRIGDYTDFYASREHATNVGKMFRDPENALLPNWLHIPVGYHGRASSVNMAICSI